MDRSKSVLISVIVVLLLGLGYVLFFTSSDVSLEDTVTKEKVTVDVEKAPSEVDKSFVSQEEEIDTEVVATSSDDTEDTTISEDMTVYEAPESGETGNEDEKNQLKDMFLDDSF
ncbi:MAG: hypothetical protein H6767_00080 [Candidatus Peribacteria bacterium]|nr:MAG: hypothetical protein H6767_00080 [Candidatus Peribacteria bacterium]